VEGGGRLPAKREQPVRRRVDRMEAEGGGFGGEGAGDQRKDQGAD
jgi:hypothetical protein